MELTESKVDELEAVLKANPFNRWADILSDAFSIDYQIMEMIMSGFEELGQDKMKAILERINKGEKTENDQGIFYNQYQDGQHIIPTAEDIAEIDNVIAKSEAHLKEMKAKQQEEIPVSE